MSTYIQKCIRFPAEQINIINNYYLTTQGISFNDFIRAVVTKKVEEILSSNFTPIKNNEIIKKVSGISKVDPLLQNFLEKEKELQTKVFYSSEEYNKALKDFYTAFDETF